MAWMIVSEDGPKDAAIRANKEIMDAHWAYELSNRDKILCAGSLRTDDGLTAIGSLLILNVETRQEALDIIDADPATRAGLRRDIVVKRWNVAIFGTVVVA
ncbi:MAG: YciI family protein [Alphaproteobacteria bacterium]